MVESDSFSFPPADFQAGGKKTERPFVFWIGAGFGYGSAQSICASVDESRHPDGSTFQGAVGFAASRHLLIGLEPAVWIDGWGVFNSNSRRIYRNHFLLTFYAYPLKRTRLFAKLGVGLSSYTAYDRYIPYGDTIPSEVHGAGPGLSAGVGYDLKFARQLYISPTISYFYGDLGDLTLNSRAAIATKRKLKLITFNAAVTFHAPK